MSGSPVEFNPAAPQVEYVSRAGCTSVELAPLTKEKKMKKFPRTFFKRQRWMAFSATMIGAFLFMSLFVGNNVSANHPVLVEGNCDSPVPGTTLVTVAGTCGDYDGDGRIGTAEDTDGADRIFGTLRAALGPGTGAAAGTGANHNGTITIVASGRFAETLFIGNQGFVAGEGVANPGNVTIQAAPGVEAALDAVLQGDPAGGNATRQNGDGIDIYYNSSGGKVVLRNLTIRNYSWGIYATLNSRVTVDNCRFENNLNYGIQAVSSAQVFVIGSRFASTGFRIGGPSTVASPGHAISYEGAASGEVAQTQITGSAGRALSNTGIGTVTFYELLLGDNGGGNIFNATRNNTP
jgi:parallel beta helix pectate lyase-like protein